MKKFSTINPATGLPICEYEYMTNEAISTEITNVNKAWIEWKHTSIDQRTEALNKIAQNLLAQKDSLAALITSEMGKPLNQSIAEVEKCAWVCQYYAENGNEFLKPKSIKTSAYKSEVHYKPMGIVFAIMPWNFPFWQVFRCAAPNLMAGNSMILKHAPITTGCGLAISKIIENATIPMVFRNIIIDINQVEEVIANKYITGVTLTGSTQAGKIVGSLAGKHLKKSVLELGGSDPYIILDDANIENAVNQCFQARFLNSGQSCIAAKRLIVTSKNIEIFTEMFLEKINTLEKNGLTLGPMARADLRDQLHIQVINSIAKGANCITGGFLPDTDGFYYPPTLLTNISPGMPAFDEELFGPVATIIETQSENEAIKLANETSFGLGASVFTNNTDRAYYILKDEIDAGCCFSNEFVKSDPRLPFGGIKNSGYGRELSDLGIYEFLNQKTIYIA